MLDSIWNTVGQIKSHKVHYCLLKIHPSIYKAVALLSEVWQKKYFTLELHNSLSFWTLRNTIILKYLQSIHIVGCLQRSLFVYINCTPEGMKKNLLIIYIRYWNQHYYSLIKYTVHYPFIHLLLYVDNIVQLISQNNLIFIWL